MEEPQQQQQQPPPKAPPSKYAIRAQHTPTTITVYQAYSPSIADAAVAAGKFVPPFKRGRMTWVKPSFLWMAYRCGWATKKDQERVLALELTREGFHWALAHACLSHPTPRLYADQATWEKRKEGSVVRVQWDPERDFEFRPLEHRSLQVGLKGEAVDRYVDEWIVGIRDVTGLMQEVGRLVSEGRLDEAREKMPVEEEYVLPADVARVIGADEGDEGGGKLRDRIGYQTGEDRRMGKSNSLARTVVSTSALLF